MSCGPTMLEVVERMISNHLSLQEQATLLQNAPLTYFRTLLDRESVDFVSLKVP